MKKQIIFALIVLVFAVAVLAFNETNSETIDINPSSNETVYSPPVVFDINFTVNSTISNETQATSSNLIILTKIIELFADKVSAVKGAVIRISAKLVDENESALALKPVWIYANDTLIGGEQTDAEGYMFFEWNTSETIPGQYLINVSFPGQVRTLQETIILQPSYNFNAISIEPESVVNNIANESVSSIVQAENDWAVNINGPNSKVGNYHLTTKDTAWTILNNDYITKYVDYGFVYINDTYYRVDWKWNDPYVKLMLNDCILLDGQQQKNCVKDVSISSLTEGFVPPGIEKQDLNAYAKEIDSECGLLGPREKNFCKNNAAKRHIVSVNYDLDRFVSDYFQGKGVNDLRSSISYLAAEDAPKEVIRGNAAFIGTVNPLKKDSGRFYLELKDGFYNSNGLRVKWGLNSVLAEFNNSKIAENLTFAGDGNISRYGNITRFIEMPKNSNVTSAFLNITGYKVPEGTYTGIWFNITNYTYSIGSIVSNGTHLFISDRAYMGMVYMYTANLSNLGQTGFDGIYFTKNGTFFWRVDAGGNTAYRHYLNGTSTGVSHSLSANGMGYPTHITTNTTNFWVNDYYAPVFDAIIHKYDISLSDLSQNITIDGSIDGWPNSDFALGVNGMATDGTFLWIMDGNNRRIFKYYASNGSYHSNWSTALDFLDNNGIGIDSNYIWVGHYNANITKHTRNKFPDIVWLEIGTPNGAHEWDYSGNFNGTNKTSNLASALNTALNNGNCDCTGCSLNGNNCSIPVLFHADTPGILEYSSIVVNHNTAPSFLVNSTDDSDAISATDKGLNVTFSANISDLDNDAVKIVFCDSAGRSGLGCLYLEYCNIGFGLPGFKSCQYNTSGLAGMEYNWTSFACDNNSVCTSGVNGTFYIARPKDPAMFVNGSQVWNYSGLFDGPQTVENFDDELRTELSGCQAINGSCNVSFVFYSSEKGKLELSLINIQYDLYDTEPPVIHNISVQPKPVFINSTMNVTVNVTDNVNVTLVSATHREASINLSYNETTRLWKGTMPSPTTTGIVQLNITAVDSSNLTATNSTSGSGSGSSGSSCPPGYSCISSEGGNSSSADLMVYPGDIINSPSIMRSNNSVTFNVTIYNFGGTTASNFKVALKMDGVHVNNNTISLGASSSTVTQFFWNSTAGNHTVQVSADFTNLIEESNETNNNASINITVEDTIPPSISNIETQRGSLVIRVNISDEQNISSASALVNGTEIQLLYNQSSKLYEGSSTSVQPGTYPMLIKAGDLSGLVTTVQSSITVYADSIDLRLGQDDFWFSEPSPSDQDVIQTVARVHNKGVNVSSSFIVEFLVDNESKLNSTISVDGESNVSVVYNWTASFGNRTFKVKVDSRNNVSEVNESNNEVSRSINVSDDSPPVIRKLMLPEVPYVGSGFVVLANISDNINVSRVNLSLNSSEVSFSFNATSGLYENLTISSPPAAGTYNITLTATDVNSLATSLREEIVVYGVQPDLVVGVGDVELEPNNVSENNLLGINVTSFNNGGSDAGSFKVELLVDGISRTNNSLSIAKASRNLTRFTWNASYGSHNISIKLDSDNSVAESNESNNVRNLSFFVLDIAPPPALTLVATPSNWTNQTSHNISWTAVTDPNGLSRYEYRINYGNWSSVGLNVSFLTPSLSEGIHTIYVRATDTPGNIAEPSNISVYIDITPPNTPVIREWHSGSNWSGHNTPFLSWTDPGDKGSGVKNFTVSVNDGQETGLGSNLSYHSASLTTGTHTFKVRAYDALGQASNWSNTITIYIDTTIPNAPQVTSPTHPDNNTWYDINTPVFNITPPSDSSGIQGYYYILDKKTNTSPDTMSFWTTNMTINLTNLGSNQYGINGTNSTDLGVANGEWYMHVIAKDNVGNLGTGIAHYKVNINVSKLLVTNFTVLHKSGFYRIFGFSVLNSGSNNVTDVNWSMNTGESIVSSQYLMNLSGGESVKVYFANTYSNYGAYSVIPSASSGSMIGATTSTVTISPIEVANLSVLNSTSRKRIFGFDIMNLLSNNLSNASWAFDTKNNDVINSSSNFSLLPYERVLIFVEHNFTSSGVFNVNSTVRNSSFVDWQNLSVNVG